MKRASLSCLVALLCSQALSTYAATAMTETGPGCGLGAMLWADSASKKHIVEQSMIATTNGIGSQTFAISSGTSGCTNDGVIVKKEHVNVFAGINFESLKQEMAQGEGEHVASLATLLGVPEANHSEFFQLLQSRYDELLPTSEVTSVGMLNALYNQMSAHPTLVRRVASGQ